MKRIIFLLASVFCITLLASQALAITVDFVPTHQVVNVGEKFAVYLHISGLEPGTVEDEKVGGFDIDIGYSSETIEVESVKFGAQLGNPTDNAETSTNFIMHDGWFWVVENSKLSYAQLSQLQGFAVTVLEITFKAVSPGTAYIFGDGYYVKDQNGDCFLCSMFSPETATVTVVKGKKNLPDSF